MKKALFISFLIQLYSVQTIIGQPNITANPDRMEKRILALSAFGVNPQGGVSRLGFSEADIAARKFMINLMEQAGLEVRIDAGGNIIGKRKGKKSNLPVILFGSHIDSVPEGGNYDGNVGVIGALECIELLNENNITTKHPLEMVIFSDEEGGLTGSQVMIGTLQKDDLDRISNSGKSVGQGINDIGGNTALLNTAKRSREMIAAFLELHIEQGAILYEENVNIGVVEGIVGIEQWEITITGKANHAGTTPMNKRQDALISAAKLVLAVNEIIRSVPGTQVGTVGVISAEPGAPNVIPGKVKMMLEMRELSRDKMLSLHEEIRSKALSIADESGTNIEFRSLNLDIYPALADNVIQDLISESARDLGLSFQRMPSFAGHDAQDMARITSMGMIFVPSKHGISHSPKEFTSAQDMANGASVLFHTILKVDRLKD